MNFAWVNWTYLLIIVVCVVLLIAFSVLFYFADRWGSRTAAPKKEAEKPKQEISEEPNKVAAQEIPVTSEKEKVERDIELNKSNLANDLEQYIDIEKKSKEEADSAKDRVFRSRLSSTGRMRQYYEKKHRPQRQYKEDGIYNLDLNENSDVEDDGLKLTVEDMKRLKMLQEIMAKKENNWPVYDPNVWS